MLRMVDRKYRPLKSYQMNYPTSLGLLTSGFLVEENTKL